MNNAYSCLDQPPLALPAQISTVCVCATCRTFNIVDAIMKKLDDYANDLEKTISERTYELHNEQMKAEMLLYSVMPP